jgi:hypothetical protein
LIWVSKVLSTISVYDNCILGNITQCQPDTADRRHIQKRDVSFKLFRIVILLGSSRIFITIFRIARAHTRQLMDMLGHFMSNVRKLPIKLTILNILKDMPRFILPAVCRETRATAGSLTSASPGRLWRLPRFVSARQDPGMPAYHKYIQCV